MSPVRALLTALMSFLWLAACGDDTPSSLVTLASSTVIDDSSRPRLIVSDGCASVVDETTNEVHIDTCLEPGTDPALLWNGPISDGIFGLMRTRDGTRFESVSPSNRLIEYGPNKEFALLQLGTRPATVITVRQMSEIGDVLMECTIPNVIVECHVTG